MSRTIEFSLTQFNYQLSFLYSGWLGLVVLKGWEGLSVSLKPPTRLMKSNWPPVFPIRNEPLSSNFANPADLELVNVKGRDIDVNTENKTDGNITSIVNPNKYINKERVRNPIAAFDFISFFTNVISRSTRRVASSSVYRELTKNAENIIKTIENIAAGSAEIKIAPISFLFSKKILSPIPKVETVLIRRIKRRLLLCLVNNVSKLSIPTSKRSFK